MAFKRVSFENGGEPEPQGTGERWLADVENVPGFSESDRQILEKLKGRSMNTFDLRQRRRLQALADTNVDIIGEQLDTLRRIFGYSPRS